MKCGEAATVALPSGDAVAVARLSGGGALLVADIVSEEAVPTAGEWAAEVGLVMSESGAGADGDGPDAGARAIWTLGAGCKCRRAKKKVTMVALSRLTRSAEESTRIGWPSFTQRNRPPRGITVTKWPGVWQMIAVVL